MDNTINNLQNVVYNLQANVNGIEKFLIQQKSILNEGIIYLEGLNNEKSLKAKANLDLINNHIVNINSSLQSITHYIYKFNNALQ